MSQEDVYEYLKNRREMGDDSWFTPREVEDGLRMNGITTGIGGVRGDLFRLYNYGLIEVNDLDTKGITNWRKVFRYKRKK